MLIESKVDWIPMGIHGSIPYPQDNDIEAAVTRAIVNLTPRNNRPTISNIKYFRNGEVIIFELID